MQQKHVITHPDGAGRIRSFHNQNYPEKYFRVTILFSYELQLLCVCYCRSLPEIVYLKCYHEFIFFQFTYNFTLLFIWFLFNSLILGVIKIGGPCFVLSRNSAAHLDHFQSDKWDSCIENRDVEPFSLIIYFC